MKKHCLLVLTILMIAAQLLSACAQPSTPAPTKPAPPPTQPATQAAQPTAEGAVTIDWKAFSGTTLHLLMNKHAYTDSISKFTKEFTDLTGVEIVIDSYAQDEFMNKRLVEFSSGAGNYDFTMMDQATPQYARAGWIEDLGPYFEKTSLVTQTKYDIQDIANLFLSQFTVDGKIYAIPVAGEAQIVYYRKDIFEEKGS